MAGRNSSQNLWHSTASELVDHAQFAETITADLVIIGGGFTGCSAALHAAEAGAKVVLLEAQVVGHGASGRNSGYVNAGLWTPPDDVEELLGRDAGERLNAALTASPKLVLELIRRHGIACDAAHVGSLHLAHSAAGLRDLERRLDQQRKRQVPVVLLNAKETEERTGTSAYRASLYDPRAVIIQPYSYCRGLARAAVEAGAAIYEASRVTAVRREPAGWRVETHAGSVTAPSLINATDAYHSSFPGLTLPTLIPAHYFQVATAPLSPKHLQRILPGKEGCWDTATVMTSIRLDRSGRLVVGSAGSLQHGANTIHTNWAHRKMLSLFPFLGSQPLDYTWHGIIGMTADHLPKILKLGENAYAAFGYSGRGIGPGTVFGKALADFLIRGDVHGLPVPPLEQHRERFTRAKQIYYETGCSLTHLVGSRFR